MFHNIPRPVADRMKVLEKMDAEHRRDRKPPLERLRQVPPETGRFIAIVAAAAPAGAWLEIGTSGGYSALWLSLACRAAGGRLTTFEILDAKIALARETFREAGVEDVVELVEGDAREHLGKYEDVSFCFLDAEKDHYAECYEKIVPHMVPGGILVADNAISHGEVLARMLTTAIEDDRMDSLVVPVGSGVLLGRRI